MLSWGSTLVADVLGGFTYIDFDTTHTPYGVPEVVIGEDIAFGVATQIPGVFIPEAHIDLALNSLQTLHSWDSTGNGPTSELRFNIGCFFNNPMYSWYWVEYRK